MRKNESKMTESSVAEHVKHIGFMTQEIGRVLLASNGNAESDWTDWLAAVREYGIENEEPRLRTWYVRTLQAVGVTDNRVPFVMN